VSDESKGNGLVVSSFLLGFWFMLELQKISPATFNIPLSKLPALILVREVGIDSPNHNQLSVDWQATRWLPLSLDYILCLELPVFCKYTNNFRDAGLSRRHVPVPQCLEIVF